MQGLHNSRAVIGPKLAGDVEKALRLESTGDRNDRAAGGDTEARVDCIDDDIGVIPDGTRSWVSKHRDTHQQDSGSGASCGGAGATRYISDSVHGFETERDRTCQNAFVAITQ